MTALAKRMEAPKLPLPKPPRGNRGAEGTPETSFRVIAAFAGAAIVVLSVLVYLSATSPSALPSQLEAFARLDETFTTGGVEKLQEAKRALGIEVARTLRENHDAKAVRSARNIAVYLFPSLLSDDDFEKDAAMELWLPLEQAIERAPHTPESRLWLEELRANIWNYESAERSSPHLSPYAQQVIRIYDTIARP